MDNVELLFKLEALVNNASRQQLDEGNFVYISSSIRNINSHKFSIIDDDMNEYTISINKDFAISCSCKKLKRKVCPHIIALYKTLKDRLIQQKMAINIKERKLPLDVDIRSNDKYSKQYNNAAISTINTIEYLEKLSKKDLISIIYQTTAYSTSNSVHRRYMMLLASEQNKDKYAKIGIMREWISYITNNIIGLSFKREIDIDELEDYVEINIIDPLSFMLQHISANINKKNYDYVRIALYTIFYNLYPIESVFVNEEEAYLYQEYVVVKILYMYIYYIDSLKENGVTKYYNDIFYDILKPIYVSDRFIQSTSAPIILAILYRVLTTKTKAEYTNIYNSIKEFSLNQTALADFYHAIDEKQEYSQHLQGLPASILIELSKIYLSKGELEIAQNILLAIKNENNIKNSIYTYAEQLTISTFYHIIESTEENGNVEDVLDFFVNAVINQKIFTAILVLNQLIEEKILDKKYFKYVINNLKNKVNKQDRETLDAIIRFKNIML